jgi:hypothetical protein
MKSPEVLLWEHKGSLIILTECIERFNKGIEGTVIKINFKEKFPTSVLSKILSAHMNGA